MIVKAVKRGLVLAAVSVLAFGAIVIAAPAPEVSAATCKQQMFGYGSSGSCVSKIQTMLNLEGGHFRYANWSSLSVDGQFGPLTRNQVKAFQSFSRISQDGIVGPVTWNHLCSKAQVVISSTSSSKTASALQKLYNEVGC